MTPDPLQSIKQTADSLPMTTPGTILAYIDLNGNPQIMFHGQPIHLVFLDKVVGMAISDLLNKIGKPQSGHG